MNKKHLLITLGGIVVVGGIITSFFVRQSNLSPANLVSVQKGDIIQEISATGNVESPSDINLRFKNSGKLTSLKVKIGDVVSAGQILAELDSSQLDADIMDMQSGINLQKAKLNQLRAGNSQENIMLSETSVAHAKSSYDSAIENLDKVKNVTAINIAQAQKNYDDIIGDTPFHVTNYEQAVKTAQSFLENTIKTSDQNVKNKKASALTVAEDKLGVASIALDNIQRLLDDSAADNLLSVLNTNYLYLTKTNLDLAKTELTLAKNKLIIAKTSQEDDDINLAFDSSNTALNLSYTAITYCYQVLENTITSSSFPQSSLDSYKSAISSQRTLLGSAVSATQISQQNITDALLSKETNTNSAQKALEQSKVTLENMKINYLNALELSHSNGEQQITTAQSQVDSALKSYETAKAQLAQVKAPVRASDIAVYQAQIAQAETSLQKIQTQRENLVITAPSSGVVAEVSGEEGETIGPDLIVISLTSGGVLQIKLNVVEDKIVGVKVGQTVKIMIDAINQEIFTGRVVSINPAQTIIGGAVYYQTIILFDKVDERLKPGMTANIWIKTAISENALSVPASAVRNSDGQQIVQVYSNKKIINKDVSTGIKNDAGMIEITSGLIEGDQVVLDNIK
ncbi:MAG: efflux RND transporter periplasmic adaptor subunit [Patescibacteria group bacterium]|jgi:multidrug efflux pump subunit AcrA (membrane-fusion protein)